MPARARRVHPVEMIRQSLEMSRARFAKLLGVSESRIESIEYGSRGLGDDLADAMMFRFGVRAESLKVNRKASRWSKPKSVIGGKSLSTSRLMKNCILEWEWFAGLLDQKAVEIFDLHLVHRLRELIKAATQKNVGLMVSFSLDKWVHQTVDDFGLRFQIRSSSKRTSSRYFSRNLVDIGRILTPSLSRQKAFFKRAKAALNAMRADANRLPKSTRPSRRRRRKA